MFRRISTVIFCAISLALMSVGVFPLNAQEAKPGPTDKDAPKEFTKTESGLKYKILRKSDGKKPTARNSVTCHYRGWLDSGKEFDNSYKRNEPATFRLGGVIKGWTEGLQLVGEGGMIELEIPGKLGYGPGGNPDAGIAPDATLHFVVELISVK
jgi:FKBP-type peptidyl-prolyl cis-trans isomerase FkpA